MLRSSDDCRSLQLVAFTVKRGSDTGDHYASVIQRIDVTYQATGKSLPESRSFIMKTIPDGGEKQKHLSQLPMFTNERRVYLEVLSNMEEILKHSGEEKWWPRYNGIRSQDQDQERGLIIILSFSLIYSSDEPLVLLFNDVTVDGFKVDSEPCDMEKTVLIIEKIAKYHALSMILHERNAIKMDFQNTYASPTMKEMISPMKHYIRTLGSAVKTWSGFKELGVKLEDPLTGEKILDDMLKTLSTEKQWGFNVLNHGDFHVRNLMFRGHREVLFLDFQIPLFNSPAFDLIGMLMASCNYDVRERKEEVVYKYHRQLVQSLNKYGYKGSVPSAIDIHMEMLRSSPLGNYLI